MSEQTKSEHQLVIERCVVAIYDYTTRSDATKSNVMQRLKDDGFTTEDISEAVDVYIKGNE